MKRMSIMLAAWVVVGCALTVQDKPVAKPAVVTAAFEGDRQTLLNRAKKVLLLEGYEILSFDDSAGVISTAFQLKPLRQIDADCGRYVGVPVVGNPLQTRIGYSVAVIAIDHTLQVKANIRGHFLPGPQYPESILDCVSQGAIERELLAKILAQ